MRLLAYFRSLAAKFFRPSQIEDEMDEELHAHVQHRTDDLERSGLDPAEAERRARIEFGGRSGSKRNAAKHSAATLSRSLYRMCASAFACYARLPDSQLSPF